MSITRFELTIHLTTTSPLHSGGVDAMVDPTREGLDREVVATRFARDAHERPILTGRSVKGAVRAACARYLESNPEFDVAAALKNAQASLWGDRGKKSPSGTPLRASALTFHTVEIPQTALVGSEPDESSNIERRETGSGDQSRRPALPRRVGIAMNRHWGAVGDGALFEHEFVPGGTELTLVITAEGVDGETTEKHARSTGKADNAPGGDTTAAAAPRPATAAEVKALLKLIVGLFQAGRVFFGGRQGAGWGRVELDEKNPAEFRELTLSNRADLKALLIPTDCDSSSSGTRLTPTDCGSSAGTRITIIWNSPAGILVADPGLSQQDKAKRKKEREAALAEGGDVDDEPVRCAPTVPTTARSFFPGARCAGRCAHGPHESRARCWWGHSDTSSTTGRSPGSGSMTSSRPTPLWSATCSAPPSGAEPCRFSTPSRLRRARAGPSPTTRATGGPAVWPKGPCTARRCTTSSGTRSPWSWTPTGCPRTTTAVVPPGACWASFWPSWPPARFLWAAGEPADWGRWRSRGSP